MSRLGIERFGAALRVSASSGLFDLIHVARGTVLLAAALCTVWTYSSIGRPIWIDEFLHFALGSHHSSADAWDTIRTTGLTINFGQTGAYMMIDYWLLQIFGASTVWLRMPSLVSATLLLCGAVKFFRSQGYQFFWPLVAVAALFCQYGLMYYAGEARPYMPLAGASVGVLAYYSMSPDQRRTWPGRLLGSISVVWGALMHPYFSVYWLALAAFTYGNDPQRGPSMSLSGFVRHCNPTLSAIGAALYFAIGAATWLRSGTKLDLDPLQWIPSNGLFKLFDQAHFRFVPGYPVLLLNGVFAATAVILIAIPRLRRDVLRPLVSPLVLVFMALVISVMLSAESYRNHYWILERQWVASVALVTVGTIWFAARLCEMLNRMSRSAGTCLALAIAVGLGARVVSTENGKLAERAHWTAAASAASAANIAEPDIPTTNDGWVALANANIAAGGPVWPIFRKFYGK